MSEERPERPDRFNRAVDDLLKGRRSRLGPADAADRRELLLAAQLAAAREGPPHMRAAFRRRLAAELGGQPARTFPTRRAAMVAGLGLAVGAAAGIGLGQQDRLRGKPPATQSTHPVTTFSQVVIDPRPGRWIDVAALDDLADGQAQRVNVGAFSAYLVRQGDKVSGLSTICSHVPCELGYNPKQTVLVCPCHNQTFDLHGHPVRDNYPVPPLAQVRVQVVNGRVQVLGT